jgi:hypothetical protein
MRTQPSFLAYLLVPLLAVGSAIAGIPTMNLLERTELSPDAKGVSETFFGTSKEGKFLVKTNSPSMYKDLINPAYSRPHLDRK